MDTYYSYSKVPWAILLTSIKKTLMGLPLWKEFGMHIFFSKAKKERIQSVTFSFLEIRIFLGIMYDRR